MNHDEHVLLCWHSANHGLPVLENALKALRNRKVTIGRVLYVLQTGQPGPPPTLDGVPLEALRLEVEDPTRHESIYRQLREKVLPRLAEVRHLHINVSPGTPAMHAVWIVLHAGGAFPEGTRLWSSQFNPTTRRTRIDEVEFPISTYLAEIRKLRQTRPQLAVYEAEAKSAARREAFARLQRYARVGGAPLLLLGERGTGKTRLVETFIARLKQRKNVVTVPCGGLDSSLAESALFGHRKGAFTGAASDSAGFLKQANGGILFLDEVQDLPQTAQRKLVRTLPDRLRRFRPVGSDEECQSDFELVCASNLPVDKLRERLDADFFDRISHLTITIPPLRDCREDLPEDWQRVWTEMRADAAVSAAAPLSPKLEALLGRHEFPGNLRDLQRLALLSTAWMEASSPEMALDHAIAEWSEQPTESCSSDHPFGRGTRRERVNWFCGRLARWAYERFGSWQAAARELGCDEKTLRTDSACGHEAEASR